MSASLTLLLLLANAQAASDQVHSTDSGIVMRPDTYVVDTRLSTGSLENLTKVYVDADAFIRGLMPKAPPLTPKPPEGSLSTAPSFPPTGHLVLNNERMDASVVAVNGTEIGEVHALTEAVLHGVKSGCYEVAWSYRDDSRHTEQVCSVAAVRAPNPGGPSAAIYLEQGRPDRTEPEWRFGPPDRDHDGVADDDDECPDEIGPESSFGCPDRDTDRVPDYRDECPDEAGPKRADARRSDGCPARVFISAKEIVITDKIFFQTGKSRIKRASFDLLDELVAIFDKHGEIKKVEIAGHTDSQGKDSDNMALSEGRAQAVMTYFTDKGIDPARLIAKGYGETEPVADNETEDGRAANRRVEFRILEQEQRVLSRRLAPGQDPRDSDQVDESAEGSQRTLEREE